MRALLDEDGMESVEFFFEEGSEEPSWVVYRKPGHQRCYLWQPYPQHHAGARQPSPAESVGSFNPLRVSICPTQGEARQGLLILVASEGAQQPLQQVIGNQNDERTYRRFCKATTSQIQWTLSQPAPTGDHVLEDFEVDCGHYDRPPTPRDAVPSAAILRSTCPRGCCKFRKPDLRSP